MMETRAIIGGRRNLFYAGVSESYLENFPAKSRKGIKGGLNLILHSGCILYKYHALDTYLAFLTDLLI